jgi:ABC-type sugar transport system permease subunit
MKKNIYIIIFLVFIFYLAFCLFYIINVTKYDTITIDCYDKNDHKIIGIDCEQEKYKDMFGNETGTTFYGVFLSVSFPALILIFLAFILPRFYLILNKNKKRKR